MKPEKSGLMITVSRTMNGLANSIVRMRREFHFCPLTLVTALYSLKPASPYSESAVLNPEEISAQHRAFNPDRERGRRKASIGEVGLNPNFPFRRLEHGEP